MNADEMSAGSGNSLDVEYGRRKNQTLPHARPGEPAAADAREAANDPALKKRVIKHIIEVFQLLKVRNAKMCSSAEASAEAAAAEMWSTSWKLRCP